MAFQKGCIPWNKGKKGCANSGSFKKGHTPSLESRKKMSIARKGNPKKGDFEKGHIPWIKGRKHSAETRLKISIALKGKPHRGKFKKGHKGFGISGERHYRWNGGITPEYRKIRASEDFKLWRGAVFERDDWICRKCLKKGGKLHPHHIKNFADYLELRFAIDNGITFCQECHYGFHKKYGQTKTNKKQLKEFLP